MKVIRNAFAFGFAVAAASAAACSRQPTSAGGASSESSDPVSTAGIAPDTVPTGARGGADSVTACTTSPCATGGANSIKCTGNRGQTVCTPTEAAIVDRDIAKGFLSRGQLSAGSCYSCLVSAGCIDGGGFSGLECGDLAGTVGAGAAGAKTKAQACLDTLTCALATNCANSPADGIANCFCGSAAPTATGCASLGNYGVPPAAGQPNGACAQAEFEGFGFVPGTVNNNAVLRPYTTPSTGSGMANAILTCAGSNSGSQASCPQCFR